jgi:aminopeptidase N
MTARRIATCVALAALALPTAAQARAVDGSAGVGDRYFPKAGNGGYDARHYKLNLAYDPVTDELEGDARIRSRAKAPLRSFHLDFLGPQISELTVNDEDAQFDRRGQELIVTPDGPLPRGEAFVTRVIYAGEPPRVTDPDGSFEGWTKTVDGSAALGEPQGTPAWIPSNNHPTDKATYVFRVRVPEGITAVANGELTKQESSGGETLFVWHERDLMASYLAVLATGVFTIDDADVNGIPSWVAIDPLTPAPNLDVMPEAHEFLGQQFGAPYPFDSTGAISDQNVTLGYALETQTRPYYSTPPGEGTVVHEIAHQWYGNSVTLGRWMDIWLNEGFATYAEWMWDEHTGGQTAQETFDDEYTTPASNKEFWNPPPGDPKPEGLFDGTVYTRGAMTLHALRERIGEDDFFELLRRWHNRYADSHAITPQLRRLAENISGERLGGLFSDWLYERGKPSGYGQGAG